MSQEARSAASTEWGWCVTHDLPVPPGGDDCGGGEAGMCEVVPNREHAGVTAGGSSAAAPRHAPAQSSAAQTSDGWTGTLAPSLRCDYCGVEVVGSDAPSLDSAKEAHRENCPERAAATKQHYYRIKVCGYVFPQLPPGSSPEAIKAAVERAVWEDGDLDITGTTVEAEFDD